MTREMVMIHTVLRREFGLAPDLVRDVAPGDRERTEIVADHLDVMTQLLELHHGGEDAHVWPRLEERCPEEVRPLVHGMEKHHARIAELDREMKAELVSWRPDGNGASRDRVAYCAGELLSVLREHLLAEEEYVCPLIEKYISGDEWDTMVQSGGAETPEDRRLLSLGLIMYEGNPATVQDAINNMPEEVRGQIPQAAAKEYAEYATRVHGTPTPPLGSTLPTR